MSFGAAWNFFHFFDNAHVQLAKLQQNDVHLAMRMRAVILRCPSLVSLLPACVLLSPICNSL